MCRIGIPDPGVFSRSVTHRRRLNVRLAALRCALRRHNDVIYAVPVDHQAERRGYFARRTTLSLATSISAHGRRWRLLRLATGEWDTPVVVTTQCAAFSDRCTPAKIALQIAPSAGYSVIVMLDEAQMLPAKRCCVRWPSWFTRCSARPPSRQLRQDVRFNGCPVRGSLPSRKLWLRRTEYLSAKSKMRCSLTGCREQILFASSISRSQAKSLL